MRRNSNWPRLDFPTPAADHVRVNSPSRDAGTRALLLALAVAVAAASEGCSTSSPTGPAPPRTYGMGFSALPPRPDLAAVLQTIDAWAPRADRALILVSPPWDSLLVGVDAATLVRRDQL